MAQPKHKARALLEQFGVGKSTIGDRMLGTAAYGDAALTVPSPDGKSQHMVWATKAGGLEGAAAGLLKRSGITNPTPEQLAGAMNELRAAGGDRYADDAALAAQAMVQQNLAAQGRFQRLESVESFMDQVREDEKFRAEVAPYMGFNPAPEPAPIGKDPTANEVAAQAPALTEGTSAPVKPEVNDWFTATVPELVDVPVLGGIPRWGYLGAAGAGGAALAYHLMAGGQQQSDPAAYTAAVQAMNAY
jgi:hypothetical protein